MVVVVALLPCAVWELDQAPALMRRSWVACLARRAPRWQL